MDTQALLFSDTVEFELQQQSRTLQKEIDMGSFMNINTIMTKGFATFLVYSMIV